MLHTAYAFTSQERSIALSLTYIYVYIYICYCSKNCAVCLLIFESVKFYTPPFYMLSCEFNMSLIIILSLSHHYKSVIIVRMSVQHSADDHNQIIN